MLATLLVRYPENKWVFSICFLWMSKSIIVQRPMHVFWVLYHQLKEWGNE